MMLHTTTNNTNGASTCVRQYRVQNALTFSFSLKPCFLPIVSALCVLPCMGRFGEKFYGEKR